MKWTSFIWGSLYLLGTPLVALVAAGVAIPLLIVGLLVAAFPWWVSLIVLGVGAIFSSPVPFGYWRGRWELQGYGASVATRYWTGLPVDDEYIEKKVKTFTGGTYFYMCVNKKKVRRELKRARELVKKKEFIKKWLPHMQEFYSSCYNTLKDQQRVKVLNK